MQKPIPVELMVRHSLAPCCGDYGGIVYLTPATEDARNWIETQAPQFGYLSGLNRVMGISDTYDLFVGETFKTVEVADYLRDGYQRG